MTVGGAGCRGAIAIFLALFAFAAICCCIEVGTVGDESQPPAAPQSPGGWMPPTPAAPPVPGNPGFAPAPPLPAATPQQTAAGAGMAVYTDPIPPRIATNFSFRPLPSYPDFFPRPFAYPTAPFFTSTYRLNWENVGILARPSEPPFVIEMAFEAETKNPYDARAVVTVRNNQTGEIVAEEGYNGEYSSEPEKRIAIREAGEYHVNIYGYQTTLTIVLREGVAAEKAVPYGIIRKPTAPQQTAQVPEEEYW
ncbi:MAG: hypothetical protein QFX32_03085 [Methanolinea sp.]|nr:hypothetical protein [Methanolinea sp.]